MPFKGSRKNNPCPICGATQWCSMTDDGRMAFCRKEAIGPNGPGDPRSGENGEYWAHNLRPDHLYHPSAMTRSMPSRPQSPRPKIESADEETCDRVYRDLLDLLDLADPHREMLRQRGLTDEQIERAGYRTLPSGLPSRRGAARELHIWKGDILWRVPGFFLDEKEGPGIHGMPGILIPARDEHGRILGLQVRADHEGNGGKYSWLSSSSKGGASSGILPHLSLLGRDSDEPLIFTEGHLKADVIAALSGRRVLSVPGVSCFRVAAALLSRLGVTAVDMAYDADRTGNDQVRRSFEGACAMCSEAGLQVRVLEWEAVDGKGLDDLLVNGKFPRMVELSSSEGPPRKPGETIGELEESIMVTLEAARQDPAAAFVPDFLRLLAQVRRNPPIWARVKVKVSKIKGVGLRDLDHALRPMLMESMIRARRPRQSGSGMDGTPPEDQDDGEGDPDDREMRMELDGECVLQRDRSYHRETYTVDRLTGLRIPTGDVDLTNWALRIMRSVKDRETGEIIYEGRLLVGDQKYPVRFNHETYHDPKLLLKTLTRERETGVKTSPRREREIVEGIRFFNGDALRQVGTTSPGYVDDETYVMPSIIIRHGEVIPNVEIPCLFPASPGNMEVMERYDLYDGTDEDALEASCFLLGTVLELQSSDVTLPALAAVLSAPLFRRFGWLPFTTYLEGELSAGKTMVCRALLNMFSDVSMVRPGGLLNAYSTPNSLQMALHSLRDVPAVIDDVKQSIPHFQQLVRLFQQQYDGGGRGRLSQDLAQRKSYPSRAAVLVTGEEIPQHEASTISRMLIVNVVDLMQKRESATNDDEVARRDRLIEECERKRRLLPILTTRWIAWSQCQNPAAMARFDGIEFRTRGNRAELFCRQMLTTLRAFFRFLQETFPYWKEHETRLESMFQEARAIYLQVAQRTVRRINAERKEEMFIQGLASLIASGRASVGPSGIPSSVPCVALPYIERPPDGAPVLRLDVIVDTAVSLVSSHLKVVFAKNTLGQRLADAGYLKETRSDGRPSLQGRAYDGRPVCVWRMEPALLIDRDHIRTLMNGATTNDQSRWPI